MSFLLIMIMFLANTCIFFISKLTIPCCIFSAHHDIVYCSWKDLVAIYMHMLHICSTGRHGTVEHFVKNFGVLGFSHGIADKMKCWLNRMVTSENGIIHMYTCAVYITYMYTCTYILDVSKRGVLGSADDDIALFLCIFCDF